MNNYYSLFFPLIFGMLSLTHPILFYFIISWNENHPPILTQLQVKNNNIWHLQS
jgi:hypothetical protein